MKTNVTFMAFAAGKQSTEGTSVKRYIGVAPVKILAINPSKQELEKLYNTELEKDPEYVSITEVGEDKHKVETVRIDFIVNTVPEKCDNIDFMSKVSFFIRNEYRYNRDKTKVQVIDKYGRTAWVTIEQAKKREIPMYSNGPANLDADYRPVFVGEEDLTNFLKEYPNIPNVMKYVNNKWVMNTNTSDSEARLESIKNYFKGDFTELRNAVALQPDNKIKVLFGVKTTDDNRQFQAVFTQMFLRNNVTNYSRLDKELNERKQAGAYPTTEFQVCELKEYTVEATDFNKVETPNDDPFGAPQAENTPWEF